MKPELKFAAELLNKTESSMILNSIHLYHRVGTNLAKENLDSINDHPEAVARYIDESEKKDVATIIVGLPGVDPSDPKTIDNTDIYFGVTRLDEDSIGSKKIKELL